MPRTEKQKQWQKDYLQRYPERERARVICRAAIKSGKLIRGPCERCGSKVKTDAHHTDYSQPLLVHWFCPECHADIHRSERAAIGAASAKTHCKRGHELSGENLKFRNGRRHLCRECQRMHSRIKYASSKQRSSGTEGFAP